MAPLSGLIRSRQQREPIAGRGALVSVMVQGLTMTRLPAPLLLTATNCRRWCDQQSERQPRSAGELRTVQLRPSPLVMIRLPVPLLRVAPAAATSTGRSKRYRLPSCGCSS